MAYSSDVYFHPPQVEKMGWNFEEVPLIVGRIVDHKISVSLRSSHIFISKLSCFLTLVAVKILAVGDAQDIVL